MDKAYINYKDTITVNAPQPVPRRYDPLYNTRPYFRRLGFDKVSIGDSSTKNRNGIFAAAVIGLAAMVLWSKK